MAVLLSRTAFHTFSLWLSSRFSDNYKRVCYTAAQDCFKSSVNVLDAKSANTLLVDQHEFPFSFQLPADLPPSFKGKVLFLWLQVLTSRPCFFFHGVVNRVGANIERPKTFHLGDGKWNAWGGVRLER